MSNQPHGQPPGLKDIISQLQNLSGGMEEVSAYTEKDWYPSETTLQIVKTALRLFSADVAALLKPSDSGRLTTLAVDGEQEVIESCLTWLSDVVKDAVEDGVLSVQEISSQPKYESEFTRSAGIKSFSIVVLPPDKDHQPLAVLYLASRRHFSFEESELKAFADQSFKVLRGAVLLRLTESLRSYRDNEIKPGETLKGLADWIRITTQADVVVLYPYFQVGHQFEASPQISGELRTWPSSRPGSFGSDDIAFLLSQQKMDIFASDSARLFADHLGGNSSERRGGFEKREGIRSVAALPLLADDELFGVLFVNYRKTQTFDEKQREKIQSLAYFAAQTIKRTRERDAVAARHVRELELLKEIDREISKTQELMPVLNQIVLLAKKNIPAAEDISIRLYDPETNSLATEAADGPFSEMRYGHTLSLSDDKDRSIVCLSCINRIPIRVDDLGSPEWCGRYFPVAPDMASELVVPILDDKELIGVINLESPEKRAFTDENQKFLSSLAGRAVSAIRNARVYERAKLYEQQTVAILNFDKESTTKDLLESLLAKSLSITRSESGGIWLYDPRFEDLYMVAGRNIAPGKERFRLKVAEGRGISSWVVKNKKPLMVDSLDPQWEELYEEVIKGMRWQLTVPILKNKMEVRGVIVIERPSERAFSVDDLDLMTHMANLGEIALRIAEHSKGQARLKALHEVDVKIISQLEDKEEVMWTVLEQALKLTQAEQGDLHLYENGKPVITYFAVKEEQKVERKARYEEGAPGNEIKRGIVARVALTRESYRTCEDAQSDPFFEGDPTTHSEIAVPLLWGNELIGILNLESREHDDMGEDDLNLLELLAGQGVIAIQNADHYAKAQEEKNRFKQLLNVSLELSKVVEIGQIDKAYDPVIKEFGENHEGLVVIRRYDEVAQTLKCVATGGKEDNHLELPPVAFGDGVIGLVAERWFQGQRGELMVPDTHHPPPGIDPKLVYEKTRSLVVVPIGFGDRFFGTLSSAHVKPNYFKQGEIDLIIGLAERLGITIHRLEAVEAQHEAEQRIKESEGMVSIGQAASEITHRLGNQLGTATTRLDEIRDELRKMGYLSDTIADHLERIGQNVGNTLKLNKTYKEFATKIRDEENIVSKRQKVSVREIINDVFNAFRESPKIYHFESTVSDGITEIPIVADQVSAILHNLVKNAVEAMPNGGTINIRALDAGRYVKIQVADNGPGISRATQDKIWTLFYSTKESSGFGLWSARRYALAHRGDLKIEHSQLGQGATFALLLPKE